MTEPGAPFGPLREEEARGVRDLGEAALGHLEDADLIGRPEPVLDGAQDPVRMVSLALEVEHGVDEVLEHARAGQRPFLGDVPDQEGGDALALGEQHQARPAFADLADAARRGLEAGQVDGLDGVHDQDARAQRLHVAQDDVEVVLGHEVEARGRDPEPLGPELDLSGRLLARDIEHRAGALRQRASRLQEQGGLADPRIAADQDERVLDQASSQHPIQLADPRRDPLTAIAVDRRQWAAAGSRPP